MAEVNLQKKETQEVYQELASSDFLSADWKSNAQEKINRIVEKEIFKIFAKIINKKSQLDILKCVSFKDRLILGTDLECSLVYENGQKFSLDCAIPVELLKEKRLSELSLTVESIGKVRLGDLTVKAYPIDEFPSISLEDKGETWEIDTSIFLNAIEKSYPFCSTDKNRYVLNGILWRNSREKNLMTFCTTDGRRLQLFNLPSQIDRDFEMIISAESLKKCIEILSKIKPPNLSFAIQSQKSEGSEEEIHQLIIKFEKFSFVTRLIQGNFPDYTQVIPKDSYGFLLLHKGQVLDLIKKVQLMEKVNKIRCEGLNFALKKGKVTLWTKIGESISQKIYTEELQNNPRIDEYRNLHLAMPMRADKEFSNLIFILDSEYLKEALSIIDSERFVIGFKKDDKTVPLIILDPEWNKGGEPS